MNKLKEQLEKNELFFRIQKLASEVKKVDFTLEDCIHINLENSFDDEIKDIALNLKPWRKGPFCINDLFIDTEWRSFIKFNLLKPFMSEITDKIVADIGCNNGYYMFKMLEFKPKKLVGFDPSIKYRLQFELINALLKADIKYELLGLEDILEYECKFDVIFCLGVLYHRADPLLSLKKLKQSLNKDGILFLDTLYIDDEREIALIPRKTYSKIPNIFYIPSILALRNWCERAGFKSFEVLATKQTDDFEQRKTQWIDSYSLENFLDVKDKNFTCEGYAAPRRVYVKLKV